MVKKKKPISYFFGKMSKEDADAMEKDIEKMRKKVVIRDFDFNKLIHSKRKRKRM